MSEKAPGQPEQSVSPHTSLPLPVTLSMDERISMEAESWYIRADPAAKYNITDTLGSGSFSVVKVAIDKESGQRYAIKIMEKQANNLKRKAMVDNEINCWRKLKHPHIIQLKEVYETEENYYIVQELVTGGELFDKIVEYSHYSEKDASNIVLQIVSAINSMHEVSVIHRDLKPENLLLSDQSANAIIKLADFGLASLFTDEKKLHKAVGTPGYIAPEVLFTMDDETRSYDKQSDVWAIGVIMYILLCGYPPFYSEDDDEIFDLTMAGQFVFHESAWAKISTLAKDLIKKILVVDPKKRWTCQQILEHPWMKGNAPSDNLESTLVSLKKFNAKKRWKAAINATVALDRFKKFPVMKQSPSPVVIPEPSEVKDSQSPKPSKSPNGLASASVVGEAVRQMKIVAGKK
eukprot:TRINITY_DN6855_c0_g2_i1.p1 TRINITY_DN6855_c0_g2~~TRINITY_DN6855_c0_g2_i1.p1  ORF type:complete len:405 (+),score=88.38 TRINITY_DN6855_c0_g2_i1:54-1268(+)